MTSSLVGSEMCIRDSPTLVAPQRIEWVLSDLDDGGEARAPAPLPCYAVSYTHLTLPTICSV
eukprot:63853-Prorocentrum_lima.AAC.1